ncbi:Na/Pi cotransporter family protein [Butyricicoccus sp.]|uniref:Na/Pi cotransporter family protein n=1 Tax=Butyricicoccus sp. TaxID=2049021 RepID=UPI003D7EACA8
MGFSNILALCGGLGLFLFGMKYMGAGLELAAGPKLNNLLEKLTRNPVMGFLLGVFVTACVQSSSATTIMCMGFLNAGIMDLLQAAGVILGANVGTTMTSILIALDISWLAPVCIFVGALMQMFCKKKVQKYVGQIILGFGILFQGLHTMSDSMSGLKDMPEFQQFIASATNPFLGFVVGLILCGVIQSSSAAVGVLQALAMQGLMPMHFAAFLICGINVGSSITPFLSAIGAKNNTKRAAVIYCVYNVIGAIIFIPICMLTPFVNIYNLFTSNTVVQISMFHITFKLVTALILLPFVRWLVDISYRVIPKKVHENAYRFVYIDSKQIDAPSATIHQLYKESERMGGMVRENLILAAEGMLNNDVSQAEKIRETENVINFLNHGITDYLVQFSGHSLPAHVPQLVGNMFHLVGDLERIGDHAINLLEKTEQCLEKDLIYSEEARQELKNMYEADLLLFDRAFSGFLCHNLTEQDALELHHIEDKVDNMKRNYENNHIKRLSNKQCATEPGIIFVEALHDFEKIGDHADDMVFIARKNAQISGGIRPPVLSTDPA